MSIYNIENPDSYTAKPTVSVGSSSTTVILKNDSRKSITLVNISNEFIFIGIGEEAVLNKGFALSPNGGALHLSLADGTNYIGNIYAICASGSKNLTVVEGV